MKKIRIFSSDCEPIYLIDDNEDNLEVYTKNLSKILESNNIVLLHMTSGSVILRPHTISSIIVNDEISQTKSVPVLKPKSKSKKNKNIEKEPNAENKNDINST